MSFISHGTWVKLNKLTCEDLIILAKFMGVGRNMMGSGQLDKDEIIMILSTESEENVLQSLRKMKNR